MLMMDSNLRLLLFIVLFNKSLGFDFFMGKKEVKITNVSANEVNELHCAENSTEKPMKNFNLGKFLGEWYEVRNYGDDGYDREGVCAKITFKYDAKQNIVIENTRTITRIKTNIQTQAYNPIFARADKGFLVGYKETKGLIQETAKFLFQYTEGIEKMQNNNPQKFPPEPYQMTTKEYIEVIHTDYENYAIIGGCSKGMFWGTKKFGWLLSRIPENHMDDKEKDKLFQTFGEILGKMNNKKVGQDYPNKYIKDDCFSNYKKSNRPIPPWKGFTGDLKIEM